MSSSPDFAKLNRVRFQDRWYVVPKYTTGAKPHACAEVHNRWGEFVAEFEDIDEAEKAVAAVNGERHERA